MCVRQQGCVCVCVCVRDAVICVALCVIHPLMCLALCCAADWCASAMHFFYYLVLGTDSYPSRLRVSTLSLLCYHCHVTTIVFVLL